MIGVSPTSWTEPQIELVKEEFHLLNVFRPQKQQGESFFKRAYRAFSPWIIDTQGLKLKQDDQQTFDKLLTNYDLIWIHGIKTANNLGHYRIANSVVDLDDYSSQFHWTMAKNMELSLRQRSNRLRRSVVWWFRERYAKKRFDALVICKAADKAKFGCANKTFVIANGFERQPTERNANYKEKPLLGMIGNFDYVLNSNAIDWFLENCWQKLRAGKPSLELHLIGKGSERYSQPDNNIQGLGFVDDPTAELSQWCALIAPTNVGGGTSVKIAEAFARKIPVVSTSHGARGYFSSAGEPRILIADDEQSFIEQCEKIIQSEDFSNTLANNAYQFYEQSLTWDSISDEIDRCVQLVIQKKNP
ncbi:Glycosyltransferase involved in cell wall bisynthesis [Alteromonadaceae bacterium Bs31]|nr:Glycosyltransferase involved in cell wall bisynthesis [Alteromonadaceae bacterium Bs31]